jgi:alpha,alpha-trehalase
MYNINNILKIKSVLQKALTPLIFLSCLIRVHLFIEEMSSNFSTLLMTSIPMAPTGGRFREFYYWDTYWIIQGLLLSEMYDTTRGILENFLSMVEKYGFVPNGGRVYYVERSQPPLLIPMVASYVTQTSNITFLKKYINLLEAEFQFWLTNRTVTVNKNGKNYKLARYYAASEGPRPESYRYEIIKNLLDCTDGRRVSNET